MASSAAEIDQEEEVTDKKRLYFAIAAGIATAVFSTMVINVGEGVLAHASTEELAAVEQKCHKELMELKKELEKAKAARETADARLAEANATLTEVVQRHIVQGAADTREIKTNMEWIRSGVDRLMKDKALKPEYR